MKLILFALLALAGTITVSCLQCYDCGTPITDLLPASQCLNRIWTCEGENTTCISITQDQTNVTLIARGCAPVSTCDNLTANNPASCVQCDTDFCNNGTVIPRNESTTTSTAVPAVTTTTTAGQPSNETMSTTKPSVTTTTLKVQPTKKKNSASSVGSSLAVLVFAVVLQYKLN